MPPKVTLDTNLFYDKAEEREGAGDFDAIVDLAQAGKVELFFTATTDFEDRRGVASWIVIKLRRQGLLHESRNAGTHREYMPGGPGLHVVDEKQCSELLHCIWPDQNWKGARRNKRNDVLHLLAHKLNGHDVYVTRDGEILQHGESLRNGFGITVMSPKELIDLVTGGSCES